MITINLLPPHLLPIKRTPVPHILSLALLAGVIVVLIGLFLGKQAELRKAQNDLLAKQSEYAGLSETVKEYNQLTEQKKGLADRIETIKAILSDRIIWSKQLHTLAGLTPENFWYQRIRLTEKSFPVTRQVWNEQKKVMESKTDSVKNPVLEVSGYILPDPDGRSQVYDLAQPTTEDAEFSSMFELLQPTLKDEEFAGRQVRAFTLEYKILKTGEED